MAGQDDGRPTLSLSALDFDGDSTYTESTFNNELERADHVALTTAPSLIQGGISGAEDVDVYNLGPIAAGDRILVTMTTDDSLDGAVALFDEAGDALLVNDHRNLYLGKSGPFVDVVIRRASAACFVAVSATPGYPAKGAYALVASKESPVSTPLPRPATVLLVFDGGGNVRIGGRPAVDVPTFDASDISSDYASDTDAIMHQVADAVRADYRAFDVTILSTSEGAVFDGQMTRVFFGTYDPALLGVAEGVDEFNAVAAQDAIVFTDTFEAFMALRPSVPQMSRAIANVASHEIGHLVGLVHTSDPAEIMDVTASLAELMEPQVFAVAPLNPEVFPLGNQDAVQSLLDSVGGNPLLAAVKALRPNRDSITDKARVDRRPARSLVHLSSCGVCNTHR